MISRHLTWVIGPGDTIVPLPMATGGRACQHRTQWHRAVHEPEQPIGLLAGEYMRPCLSNLLACSQANHETLPWLPAAKPAGTVLVALVSRPVEDTGC